MRILITRRIPDDLLERLGGGHDLVIGSDTGPMAPERFLDEIVSSEAVLSFLSDRLDVETLDLAPRLRVISQMAAGVDNIDVDAAHLRDIVVGHTPGVLTEATADAAFALLAATTRRLPEAWAHARSGAWIDWRHDFLLGGDLYASTLGIVGLGSIGAAIARRARGFDMRVLYTGRSRKPHLEATLRASYRTLEDLLEESDHVVLSVPLTDATRGLIDAARLARLRPHATLVNVARGAVVDTGALVDALERGSIGGAGLDVTDPEPLPPEHPLYRQPRCLIVPHIGSATVTARRRMLALAMDNLVAGVEGRPLPSPVGGVADQAKSG